MDRIIPFVATEIDLRKSSDAGNSQNAGFTIRTVAFFVDGALISTFVVLIMWGLSYLTPLIYLPPLTADILLNPLSFALAILSKQSVTVLIGGLMWLIYFFILRCFFGITTGQTPGKQLFGLLEVDQQGDRLRPKRAIWRAIATTLIGAFYGLGILWVAFSEVNRGWHDFLSGSRVIRLPD